MFGVLYLLLAAGVGYQIVQGFLPKGEGAEKGAGNRLWIVMPASFGVGILLFTWAVYGLAWLFSACTGTEKPLFYSNGLLMAAAAVWLCFSACRRRIRLGLSTGPRAAWLYCGILLVFLTWIMCYVFHIRDGVLYSGYTVYGDYAPHTAMMRSFSWGNNYPTQYPHYGGADVKYHFMFQFLTGNLEYLGMRLDVAYNVVSVLSLLGFLMLLYQLCIRLTGSTLAAAFTGVLFVFRSGTAFFIFLWEHIKAGDLWQTLSTNTAFIGYTPNENWGLWNFNVYLNQRHLAFGMLLAALAVWVYLDWLETGAAHDSRGLRFFRERLFTVQAWKSRDLSRALFVGLFLGMCAFWNGAAVIGGLLILLGFAVFSDGKLDYLATAAVTVLLSFLQTKIFISGSSMKPTFYFGFLAEDKTMFGVLVYLFLVSGFYFFGLGILGIFWKRESRLAALGFLMPLFFAFFVSLTPDINVNHKYVMISYGFLTIFWAEALAKLFARKRRKAVRKAGDKSPSSGRRFRWPARLLGAALLLCLTATGVYDFVVILADNNQYHRVAVDMESSLTAWLGENLDSEELLLTPEYSINEVTMSGVMLYCGWPYYAWSAGYDTNYRAAVATEIYTTKEQERLKSLVEQEGITYILFEEGSTFEGQDCREELIKETYRQAYASEDGRIRIYETGE